MLSHQHEAVALDNERAYQVMVCHRFFSVDSLAFSWRGAAQISMIPFPSIVAAIAT